MSAPKKAIILSSGGLDSTTAMAIAESQGFELYSLEAVLKTFLGFKVKAGPSVQPEEYTKYFED